MLKKSFVVLVVSLVVCSSFFVGCLSRDRLEDDPNTQVRSIVFDNVTRSYRVHVPVSYDASEQNALVFVLHGGGGTADGMENVLTQQGMNVMAAEYNFVVVYPDGVNRSWNDGRMIVGENASYYETDDVGYLEVLIDSLSEEFGVLDGDVFFTGMSNGGFMCMRMGFECPEKIGAIAPVTATLAVDVLNNCSAKGPVSVLLMCGTKDPLVPYEGGWIMLFNNRRSQVCSVNDTVDFWLEMNQCDGTPEVYEFPDVDGRDGCRVVLEKYEGGVNDTVVYVYSVVGGGHTWPGGSQYFGKWLIGSTCRDIDASVVFAEVFDGLRREG